jgi:hypothetical protein
MDAHRSYLTSLGQIRPMEVTSISVSHKPCRQKLLQFSCASIMSTEVNPLINPPSWQAHSRSKFKPLGRPLLVRVHPRAMARSATRSLHAGCPHRRLVRHQATLAATWPRCTPAVQDAAPCHHAELHPNLPRQSPASPPSHPGRPSLCHRSLPPPEAPLDPPCRPPSPPPGAPPSHPHCHPGHRVVSHHRAADHHSAKPPLPPAATTVVPPATTAPIVTAVGAASCTPFCLHSLDPVSTCQTHFSTTIPIPFSLHSYMHL